MRLHLHYTIADQSTITKENISLCNTNLFLSTSLDNQQQSFSLPALQLQLTLQPLNNVDQRLSLQLQIKEEIIIHQIYLTLPYPFSSEHKMFCNGFQSWTETRLYTLHEKIPSIFPPFAPMAQHMGDYWITKEMGIDLTNALHSWTYGYIQQQDQNIHFIGSLNEHMAYTLIQYQQQPQPSISIHKDCKNLKLKRANSYLAFDLYLAKGQEAPIFLAYFQQLKKVLPHKFGDCPAASLRHIIRHDNGAYQAYTAESLSPVLHLEDNVSKGSIAGWTSWYHYYDGVSEKIVLDNLQAFVQHQVPIKIIQIDDGWQHKIGDWMVRNDKFPNGMGWLSRQIQTAGYQSGLWLAPFVCQKQSSIYRHHRHWLLKTEQGKLVTAGINPVWKSHMYVLDFYHPEVRAYLAKVFDLILHTWSFDMVKLDFLYAVARQPPAHKTHGQVLYEAMSWLREQVGEKIILGCGMPLGAAFGQVDYCRVGADVHLGWEMTFLKWMRSRERVSTILSLRNTIHRRQLNGLAFYNDPDVSMLRKKKNWLSVEQRYTLFLVNQIFGSLQFISDNIRDYDAATLHLYQSQFPIRAKNMERVIAEQDYYIIYFNSHRLRYIALCNLSHRNITQSLATLFPPEQKDKLRLFHNREHQFYSLTDQIKLQPYQSVCFLVVDTTQAYALAGSTGHLFPASEVDRWLVDEQGQVRLHFSEEQQLETKVFISRGGQIS